MRADDLRAHLSTDDALARIRNANQPGKSSAAVQATFGEFVRDLGDMGGANTGSVCVAPPPPVHRPRDGDAVRQFQRFNSVL
jgi:hypothetical protein